MAAGRNYYGDVTHIFATNASAVTVTNSTTETTSATLTIPGNTLRVGDRILIDGHAFVTSSNSTDTHQILVDIGTSGGTLIPAVVGAAVDVADSDVCPFHAQIDVIAIGVDGTGSVKGYGEAQWSTASAVNTIVGITNAANFDTVDDIVVNANVTQSVAHADNQTVVRDLMVTIIPGTE